MTPGEHIITHSSHRPFWRHGIVSKRAPDGSVRVIGLDRANSGALLRECTLREFTGECFYIILHVDHGKCMSTPEALSASFQTAHAFLGLSLDHPGVYGNWESFAHMCRVGACVCMADYDLICEEAVSRIPRRFGLKCC